MSYIDILIDNCQLAKKAINNPVDEFQITNISEVPNIKNVVYIIEEVNGNSANTFKSFQAFKNLKQRKCAQCNWTSQILYVGSSVNDFKNRLNQHMGNGYKNTYALHLKYWFKGQYKITIRKYDVSPEVLQIIEDAISHDLKPAFGKPGGNSK